MRVPCWSSAKHNTNTQTRCGRNPSHEGTFFLKSGLLPFPNVFCRLIFQSIWETFLSGYSDFRLPNKFWKLTEGIQASNPGNFLWHRWKRKEVQKQSLTSNFKDCKVNKIRWPERRRLNHRFDCLYKTLINHTWPQTLSVQPSNLLLLSITQIVNRGSSAWHKQ